MNELAGIRTLRTLFLRLNKLRQILILALPANLRPNRPIILVIARPIDIRLEQIRLLQQVVLKELIRREVKRDLVPELILIRTVLGIGGRTKRHVPRQIREPYVREVFKGVKVTGIEESLNARVIPEYDEPEVGYRCAFGTFVEFGKRLVVLVVLPELFLAQFNLFRSWRSISSDDIRPPLI